MGCSAITLRKLEAEERRPSKQIAERLAEVLTVPAGERADFLRFARGDPFAAPGDVQAPTPDEQPPAPRHNLPLQLTSFIGREKEIGEVTRLLSSARLVTLSGPGGAGKTRLALQVATGLLGTLAYPDGVWLVELAPLGVPALVPQTVAAVLGLKEQPGRPILATLTDMLRDKTSLLVLDNCEHLIGASALFAEAVLRQCPKLCIIATSREMLGVAGEQVLVVPSLSAPEPQAALTAQRMMDYEAVRLFSARAANPVSNFALTDNNAPAVAQICRRLDGMPLALELAAARLRMLPVEQIAERLNDRFLLLTGGSRTALPRHQTLQALVDWSYDLLTAPEQALWRQLSVFAGGWTLQAAEAVCSEVPAVSDSVFDRLGRLIDKSLVMADNSAPAAETRAAAPRYRLLETIRQYGLGKLLAAGEADLVRQRHAQYYLGQAEAKGPSYRPARRAWLDHMETELDNLRAALAWAQSKTDQLELGLRLAASIHDFHVHRGHWSEAQAWLEGLLMLSEGVRDQAARANALQALGIILAYQGAYTNGRDQIAHALRIRQELGDRNGAAWALGGLGWLAREHDDAATARRQLEAALAIFRELQDEDGIAWVAVTLGEVAMMEEDTVNASALVIEAQQRYSGRQSSLDIGWVLNHLAHIAQLQGDYVEAERLHQESLTIFRDHTVRLGLGWAYQGLGETALAQGAATPAAQRLAEGLAVFRDLGDRAGVSWCLAGMAGVAVLDEEPERAVRLWGAAEALRLSIGARHAPAARARRERLMAAARDQLGDAAFDAAWAEGQALTLEQAMAEALMNS